MRLKFQDVKESFPNRLLTCLKRYENLPNSYLYFFLPSEIINRKVFRILLFAFCLFSVASFASSTIYEKQAVVERVVQNIATALGDSRRPVPQVKISSGKSSQVACVYKDDRTNHFMIQMDELAFDLCMEFGQRGEDAIAALIGHELAHYYNNHHFSSEYISFFMFGEEDQKTPLSDSTLEKLTYFETQADYYGGIYGFMAGYNTFGIIPELYEKIYVNYPMRGLSKQYPSKEERIEISKKNGLKIQRLSYVFEVGNYCMLIGRYADAAKSYDFIINEGFSTRDILNNLGVAYALKAMSMKGRVAEPYIYPFEMDAQTRLIAGTKGGDVLDANAYLNKAKDNFDKASLLDPDYATARNNIACFYAITGDYRKANFYAEEAEIIATTKPGQQQSLLHSYVVRAILAKKQEDDTNAKMWLDKAGENYFALMNKSIFNGEVVNWNMAGYATTLPPSATIPGFAPKDLNRETMDGIDEIFEWEGKASDSIEFNMGANGVKKDQRMVRIAHLDHSDIIYMEVPQKMNDSRMNWLIFQQTNSDYALPTANGIKIGDSLENLETVYGTADNVIAARQGFYLFYSSPNIIFLMDAKNSVKSWLLYWEKAK